MSLKNGKKKNGRKSLPPTWGMQDFEEEMIPNGQERYSSLDDHMIDIEKDTI